MYAFNNQIHYSWKVVLHLTAIEKNAAPKSLKAVLSGKSQKFLHSRSKASCDDTFLGNSFYLVVC